MLFLFDVQSPVNVGLILRAAEQFEEAVAVYDPRGIFANNEKRQTISDFSCGALERHPPEMVENLSAWRAMRSGRVIAASVGADSIPLNDFVFENDDVIVLGNEHDGLPVDVVYAANLRLSIPLPKQEKPKPQVNPPIDPERVAEILYEGAPNLNVSTVAALVSYTRRMQLLMREMDEIGAMAQRMGSNRAKAG